MHANQHIENQLYKHSDSSECVASSSSKWVNLGSGRKGAQALVQLSQLLLELLQGHGRLLCGSIPAGAGYWFLARHLCCLHSNARPIQDGTQLQDVVSFALRYCTLRMIQAAVVRLLTLHLDCLQNSMETNVDRTHLQNSMRLASHRAAPCGPIRLPLSGQDNRFSQDRIETGQPCSGTASTACWLVADQIGQEAWGEVAMILVKGRCKQSAKATV